MDNERSTNLGRLLKQQRVLVELTLQEVASKAKISSSHLGRIERGERFPSAGVLNRIAKPLKFEVEELMRLAGYLGVKPVARVVETPNGRIDPLVARVLAEEPVEVQRCVLSLLMMVKAVAKASGVVLPTVGAEFAQRGLPRGPQAVESGEGRAEPAPTSEA